MNDRVLLDRDLTLDWLDAAALQAPANSSADARAALSERLDGAGLGATAKVKTVTVLTRSWLTPPPQVEPLVEWARQRASTMPDRRPLHLGVLMVTQPFFTDLLDSAGMLSRNGPEVTTPDLRHRMKKTWGARRSVDIATQRGVKTLRALGILHGEPSSSVSTIGNLTIADGELGAWLVRCLLVARGSDSISTDVLRQAPEFFAVTLPTYLPRKSTWITTHREGVGRTVLTIPA